MLRQNVAWIGLALAAVGCMDSLEKQVQKDPDRGIIGKTTQDIGEFQPGAGAVVSDSKVNVSNPVTGPLEAYGPMVEQISKTQIMHALNLYKVENERYPATHEEFMTDIIKRNNIRLPVLPGGKQYQYDVANHELVVVDGSPAAPADPNANPGEPAPAAAPGAAPAANPDNASPADTPAPAEPGAAPGGLPISVPGVNPPPGDVN